ncbi:UNVERIFIED_CONTAM: putative mitochondrial protein [Sesamum latifolium]|uniref:Mitochondrial protein n=1 Tax=Sesamum latifolium TaxID=2727402 RepID=A0AAW2WYW9_9LAMI
MSESFLVHYILNTLPSQYAPFKISYNTHKDKWSINELMTMCVQEEGRLSMEAGESVHMATQGKNKDQGKGKQTNVSKKGVKRSSNLLEIIHMDIYCPDLDSYGQRYFITFIDDYSHYMYIYFLEHKVEALDAFKVFKAEVEKQCDKQIKIVRSDRGGEYFGRYTEGRQAPDPLAKFLTEQDIVAQYTMPSSPDQNGVAERRNRTLLDMVQSMMASSKLPKSLWIEALKKTVYILNRVPIKAVSKTPFELFKGWKPSLRHVRIWGCPSEENVEQPVDLQTYSENVDATLRRSARIKRSAIPGDYMVYLQESEFNIVAENDPEMFSQAMISRKFNLWYDAMKDEMNSMAFNKIWDLVELPDGFKAIECKWVFKTKKDSLGNIERHKARLVAKGFTQREGIDYTGTFSPVSKKDSLRTIMELVAHFDMDLHQMDVKITFLNGELEEEVYMK